MAFTIQRAAAQQPASSETKRIASTSRICAFAAVGAAAALATGAAVVFLKGGVPEGLQYGASRAIPFAQEYFSSYSPSQETALYGALGAAATGIGALAGAAVAKFTAVKANLNDVKANLGVPGSDLNFGQIERVADITVQGGIFQNRSISLSIKSDADRIHNLNRELTNTEFSLSSNAHETSKQRGVEDRFFDFEGAKLATYPQSTSEFIDDLISLKDTIEREVKATDKYTYQHGNSSTAVNRREYLIAGIMGFAYERDLAGNFLLAAVKERAAIAKTNPKMAEVAFRHVLQNGIKAGILAPDVDATCYEGMVNAASAAPREVAGKNPDAVISSIFDALKDAGLIDGALRARFINDVRQRLSNPDAQIVDPMGTDSQHVSLRERLVNPSAARGSHSELSAGSESTAMVEETSSQRKARLAAEAVAEADSEVNTYSDILGGIKLRHPPLANAYKRLIELLKEKSSPLEKAMEMDTEKLRGVLALRHKEGFDLFGKYEENDQAIAEIRDEIATMIDAIERERTTRPANFQRASTGQKRAAEALEKEIKTGDSEVAKLKKEADAVDKKIDRAEARLSANEGKANSFLFPPSEKAISQPDTPKAPSLLEKLFGNKKTEDKVVTEAPIEGAIQGDTIVPLEEPLSNPVVATEEYFSTADEDALPEPVMVDR